MYCLLQHVVTLFNPLFSLQIRQEDIDFHQYYTNGRREDLKFRMDHGLYPPRRKVRVQANQESFFESSKSLDFHLVCGQKCINGKIIIPSRHGTYVKLYGLCKYKPCMYVHTYVCKYHKIYKLYFTDPYEVCSESDSSLQRSISSGKLCSNTVTIGHTA